MGRIRKRSNEISKFHTVDARPFAANEVDGENAPYCDPDIERPVLSFGEEITTQLVLNTLKFALHEYKFCGNIPGRTVFWAAASILGRVWCGGADVGAAVVFKNDPALISCEWSMRGYLGSEKLYVVDAEFSAIPQALKSEYERAASNFIFFSCEAVVVYTDSLSTLHRIERGPTIKPR